MRILFALLLSFVSVRAQQSSLRALSQQMEELSSRIRPSVVQVLSNGYAIDRDGASVRQSSGSGFIVSADGLIVTNAHVVSGATRIQVYLPLPNSSPGKSIVKNRGPLLRAKVLGADPETDIALLKVEATSLPAVNFADSDRARQGQMVMAFGHPLGLDEAVSLGVVSAVARQLKPDDPVIYLQTDAPINPGNSGGPLVDMDGRVVGINTLILTQSGGSEGVGFAIPSNIIRTVTDQLGKTGRVRRGFIGVSAQTITPGIAAGLGLERTNGVIISDVMPGSPADQSGIQVGDILLALNDKPMENARQFQVNLYRQGPLTDVRLLLMRNGAERLQKVTVLELPGDPDRLTPMIDQNVHNVPRLGILALEVNDQIRSILEGLRQETGVVVASKAISAVSTSGQLEQGDVIYRFDKEQVKSLVHLRKLLEAKEPGDTAVLQVERDRRLRYIEIILD
ncbi:MAG: trypsin-like peptidase domain-containing protein [Bryobacteraceae bacterium]|nr:trypsin-like peptidase domain-containing protein [Bryobacteraceae bacterium]